MDDEAARREALLKLLDEDLFETVVCEICLRITSRADDEGRMPCDKDLETLFNELDNLDDLSALLSAKMGELTKLKRAHEMVIFCNRRKGELEEQVHRLEKENVVLRNAPQGCNTLS